MLEQEAPADHECAKETQRHDDERRCGALTSENP